MDLFGASVFNMMSSPFRRRPGNPASVYVRAFLELPTAAGDGPGPLNVAWHPAAQDRVIVGSGRNHDGVRGGLRVGAGSRWRRPPHSPHREGQRVVARFTVSGVLGVQRDRFDGAFGLRLQNLRGRLGQQSVRLAKAWKRPAWRSMPKGEIPIAGVVSNGVERIRGIPAGFRNPTADSRSGRTTRTIPQSSADRYRARGCRWPARPAATRST